MGTFQVNNMIKWWLNFFSFTGLVKALLMREVNGLGLS